MDLNALQHRVLPVGHLPVIRGLIDRLGFKEVIDRYLPQHPLAKVSDAECVVAMIFNILSGRQSIWRIDQWLEKIDLELLMDVRAYRGKPSTKEASKGPAQALWAFLEAQSAAA